MKKYRLIAMIALVSWVPGCYFGITGRVIDAETNQPIEGAVALVEWTKTKGMPGMSHTESSKVQEVVSDTDGRIKLSGDYDPMVDPPNVTVYKKGYAAWNNEYIFPDYKKRTDFKWENGYVFRMEKFKDVYSHNEHISFIRSSIGASQNLEAKKAIYNSFEWERHFAQQERILKGLSP